jgi:hypothetical protein
MKADLGIVIKDFRRRFFEIMRFRLRLATARRAA